MQNQTKAAISEEYRGFCECPHCACLIEIIALNCKIFRCGILKKSGEQINQHLSKEQCDDLVAKGLIWVYY